MDASFSLLRITVVKCVGKYTVKSCFVKLPENKGFLAVDGISLLQL